MSLINQALRKAQQDRAQSKMVTPAEQAASTSQPAPVAAPSSGMKPSVIIVVALLIGIIAGLSIILLNNSKTPEQLVTTPTVEPAPPSTPIKTSAPTQPAVTTTPTPTATATTPAPVPTAPASPEASVTAAASESKIIQELRLARQAAEAKAARLEAEANANAEAKIAAANSGKETINWLAQAKITGVRLSSSGNKVILNGKTYVVGDTVHYNLGLKVIAIQEERVLFTDKIGKKYMKRL